MSEHGVQATAVLTLVVFGALFLYADAFNPSSPLANAVIGNDDFPSIGLSGFNNVSLTAGRTYYLVTTGFANTDFGAYTSQISGPGSLVV